ncbi:4743_t:CDS:2 [Ambispora gerdemannii]|uniref:4743_t:CDS:1 n=1 Tax=Ambispora gerdemannii TaxID=144530 RepID=A0A9N9G4T9_9GLOM|nr:4743_t:CDS:2 [Ambispora gerdemannii]
MPRHLLHRRDFSDNITIQTLVLSIAISFAFLVTILLFILVIRGHMKNLRLRTMKMWSKNKNRKNQVKDEIQIASAILERELQQQKPRHQQQQIPSSPTTNAKNNKSKRSISFRDSAEIISTRSSTPLLHCAQEFRSSNVEKTTESVNNFITNNNNINNNHEIVHKEKEDPLENEDEKDPSFEEQEETSIIGQETLGIFQPSGTERFLLFGFNNERRESAIIIT